MYSGAENDPIISALSEAAATFPLTEDFDFVVFLGTGEPKLKNDDTSAYCSSNIWKNGAFPRLCNMAWEKMRDRKNRRASNTHPRYHRLDVEFDHAEPRLDDARSIPELRSKVQADHSTSATVTTQSTGRVLSKSQSPQTVTPPRFRYHLPLRHLPPSHCQLLALSHRAARFLQP
jgi:hypothetical protein